MARLNISKRGRASPLVPAMRRAAVQMVNSARQLRPPSPALKFGQNGLAGDRGLAFRDHRLGAFRQIDV